MKRHIKVFLFFALLLMGLLALKLINEHNEVEKIKNIIVQEESKSLSALVIAFRKTYQERFIKNHIAIDRKSVELLPVRTMGDISHNFSNLVGGKTVIKTVSDRPRNPINKANAQEMKIIEYFNNNKEKKSYFENMGDGIFYYAQPLYIKQVCLKCHGKREDAIDLIKTNYTTAYGYKLGDLRGILSIKIDKSSILNRVQDSFISGAISVIIVFIMFLIAIFMMIKVILKDQKEYEETLENKVQEQVKELQQKEQKIFEQSKLASMGEMIGNIAHQWRQPLSIISTGATGMKMQKKMDTLEDKEFYKFCDTINDNAQYLSQTIDDFRNFIKGDSSSIKFNLKNNTDSFLKLVNSTIKKEGIEVVLSVKENIEVTGYPNELIQCFINIFNNSKDAFKDNNIDKDNRFVFISQEIINNEIVITFKDTAKGIPDDVIEHVFEPYFTTKHQTQGTGLGLHMSYALIVTHMNGSIEVSNEEFEFKGKQFKGAKFVITLPVNN